MSLLTPRAALSWFDVIFLVSGIASILFIYLVNLQRTELFQELRSSMGTSSSLAPTSHSLFSVENSTSTAPTNSATYNTNTTGSPWRSATTTFNHHDGIGGGGVGESPKPATPLHPSLNAAINTTTNAATNDSPRMATSTTDMLRMYGGGASVAKKGGHHPVGVGGYYAASPLAQKVRKDD